MTRSPLVRSVRAARVLAALVALQRTGGGIGPTVREVEDLTGVSRGSVVVAIRDLVVAGLVRKIARRKGAIEVLPLGLSRVPEIEFDGCCWGFTPVSRLATRPHGQRSAQEPASQ